MTAFPHRLAACSACQPTELWWFGSSSNCALAVGTAPVRAEKRSWERGLPVLAQDLVDAGLGSVEMLVEYQLPLSSKRVDVVLAGVNKRGDDSFIVVELKQWSRDRTEGSDRPSAVDHVAAFDFTLASKLRATASASENLLGTIYQSRSTIGGTAYLHNASEHDLQDLFALPVKQRRRIFTKQQRGRFIDYLRAHLMPTAGPTRVGAELLLRKPPPRPSKLFLQHAAEELQQRPTSSYWSKINTCALNSCCMLSGGRSSRHRKGPSSSQEALVAERAAHRPIPPRRTSPRRPGCCTTLPARRRSLRRCESMRPQAGRSGRKRSNYFNNFMNAKPNGFDVLECGGPRAGSAEFRRRISPPAVVTSGRVVPSWRSSWRPHGCGCSSSTSIRSCGREDWAAWM